MMKSKAFVLCLKLFEKCNLEMYNKRKRALKLTYQHLQTRKDCSKRIDQCDIVDNHKHNNCAKCRKEKVVLLFTICNSKYDPKLFKIKNLY